MRALASALVLALPAAASAHAEGDPIVAERAASALRVDGRLEEPAWGDASVWSEFVEVFPDEGGAPTERTEVRVLQDEATLYVGVTCHDSRPEAIARPLARRDDLPAGDVVRVAIDSTHDHRTAYSFAVSAAGVLEDRLLFHDEADTSDWDAVWEGAASITAEGWTAELAIPFAALRLRGGGGGTFGVLVERTIGRTHEVVASVLIPASRGGFVSRFGHLRVGAVDPPRGIELAPFLATRAVVRPQFSDPLRATPRLVDPVLDVGLDARVPIGVGLTLTGALNPDFGQVEADPVVLNLTRFEPFFPEKRPFFQQDMDLFEPLDDGPHQLLYTRRIGLDAPILAAAKVTGEAGAGFQIGVLDALVLGAARPDGDEERPDRRVRFHLSQPLRLAPNSALPAERPEPRNYLGAVVRRPFGAASSAGVRAAFATPLDGRCSEEDEALDAPPARCLAAGGNAVAADLDLRSPGGDWSFTGQLAASQVVGGPSARTLPDGTELARGELGVGAYGSLGKSGGEPVQIELAWEYASPSLDLNAAGFQPDQNVVALSPSVHLVRAGGLGPFRSFSAGLSGRAAWSTDGRGLLRGASAGADVEVVLPGFHTLACDGGVSAWSWDLREIEESGLAYERPAAATASCTVTTDPTRRVSFEISAGAERHLGAGRLESAGVWGGSAQIVAFVRPAPRLETRLGAKLSQTIVPGRFLEETEDALLFADLRSRALTLKLGQEVLLTRDLSLQLYGELLSASGRFATHYAAPPPASDRVPVRALAPSPAPDESFDFRVYDARMNVVLRWEYRRGSTFYLVWSRRQDTTRGVAAGGAGADLGLRPPAGTPAVDVLLAKVSLWTVR